MQDTKAIELKVKNFLENFKSKEIYNYAITLSPIFKDSDRYIDYRKKLAQLLIKIPDLTEYDPKSLIFATVKAYEQGYSFDPQDAEAYFIPYKKEIQFQKGYRGIMKDLMKRPDVIDIVADVVYEGDELKVGKDKAGRLILLQHHPNIFNRGEIIGAYAFVYYKIDGENVSNGVILTAKEIEEYRAFSKADKAMGEKSFWVKFKADMYKKTVIKQLKKVLPPLPEETINAYEKLNKKEGSYISEERKALIQAFNEAYTQSGLTAKELRSIIYTKYFVYEPGDLTNEELAELTQLLKKKGKGLLDAVVLIGTKEQKELKKLFAKKMLNEEQERKVYLYLGLDPDKIPSAEEYELLKNFLQSNERKQILQTIGLEEKTNKITSLEETLSNI